MSVYMQQSRPQLTAKNARAGFPVFLGAASLHTYST